MPHLCRGFRVNQAPFAHEQRFLRPPLLGDIVKHDHGPHHLTGTVHNRGGAVFDGDLPAVSGHQRRVVGQFDHTPFAQHAADNVFARSAGHFIHHVKDGLNRLVQRILRRPPAQRGGNGIEEGDSPVGIAGDHRVADTGQGDAQPLAVPSQGFLGLLALFHLATQGISRHRGHLQLTRHLVEGAYQRADFVLLARFDDMI
ncbi:MAG: hypothetical protein BWY76_00443 [bacterium ADurb.Bin429]|nr:MAG: hypothetical protein BWY76_00443 [bacterium ADurb.Bin429]